MPYIKKEDRVRLTSVELEINSAYIHTIGELNYLFTLLAIKYINQHGKRYEHINAVVGAFDCAKMEFYRKLAAPYEDKKIEENGDVYE